MKKIELISMLEKSGIEKSEAKAEIELILEYVYKKTKEELIFIDDFTDKNLFEIIEKRIKTGEPIQYILGEANFMGEKFIVNKNVLIPRDETELLVRKASELIKDGGSILDIGTGSGIIPCMIAKYCALNKINASILAVDISNDALITAMENAKKLGFTGNILYRKSDIYSNVKEKFDIILSNPPYIPVSEYESIQEEVKFEPETALFTKDDRGLEFYYKIISQAKEHLTKNGAILLEMKEGQAHEVTDILSCNGFFQIETFKDMAGIERVIKAVCNN